jgi:hypothetical protein
MDRLFVVVASKPRSLHKQVLKNANARMVCFCHAGVGIVAV